MKYPSIVKVLIKNCDAWLIGSSCDQENPRDYDVWVPIDKWSIACSIIPKNSKVNSFGGFKCISDSIEVDIWTCEMQELFQTSFFTKAYYPKAKIKIQKYE